MLAVMLLGSAIYLIEGPENGFTSVPVSLVSDRYLRVRA